MIIWPQVAHLTHKRCTANLDPHMLLNEAGVRLPWEPASRQPGRSACRLPLMRGGLVGKFPLILERASDINRVCPSEEIFKYNDFQVEIFEFRKTIHCFKIIWYFAGVAVASVNSESMLSVLDMRKSNRSKLTLCLIKMNKAVEMQSLAQSKDSVLRWWLIKE